MRRVVERLRLWRGILCAMWLVGSVSVVTITGRQATVSAIAGTVADPDGGAVPTALVQARNVSTGMAYKTTSDKDGGFVLSRLPAGTSRRHDPANRLHVPEV